VGALTFVHPTPALEIGKSVADAAVSDVVEETGVTVELTELVAIYTDPGHVMAYDDGEVRQEFSACSHARVSGGEAREDDWETRKSAA
jgi:ADP-ribose pyrophosphatase YjhB (NUDIX family)